MTSHLVVWTNHLHVPNGASAAEGHCTHISWGIRDYSYVIILQLFLGPDFHLWDSCLSPESALHRTSCYCCSWGKNTAVFVFLKHLFSAHLLHQVLCRVCVWVVLNLKYSSGQRWCRGLAQPHDSEEVLGSLQKLSFSGHLGGFTPELLLTRLGCISASPLVIGGD